MTNKEAIEFIEIDISRLWNTPQNLEHKEALEKAKKALSEQKTGYWKLYQDKLVCSECGNDKPKGFSIYCNKCGAKMKEDESEDK